MIWLSRPFAPAPLRTAPHRATAVRVTENSFRTKLHIEVEVLCWFVVKVEDFFFHLFAYAALLFALSELLCWRCTNLCEMQQGIHSKNFLKYQLDEILLFCWNGRWNINVEVFLCLDVFNWNVKWILKENRNIFSLLYHSHEGHIKIYI